MYPCVIVNKIQSTNFDKKFMDLKEDKNMLKEQQNYLGFQTLKLY